MNAATMKARIGMAMALSVMVMGCAHPNPALESHSRYEPAVVEEEVVIIERPLEEEVIELDCSNPRHHVYKECTRRRSY